MLLFIFFAALDALFDVTTITLCLYLDVARATNAFVARARASMFGASENIVTPLAAAPACLIIGFGTFPCR